MASHEINKEFILNACILGDMTLKLAGEILHISQAKINTYIDQIAIDHRLPSPPLGSNRLPYIRKDIRSMCGIIDEETVTRNQIWRDRHIVSLDVAVKNESYTGRSKPAPTLDELDKGEES